jgi:hypothetical protein
MTVVSVRSECSRFCDLIRTEIIVWQEGSVVGLRRSIVTLLITFALMGVASSLGQSTRAQQRTYKVSGRLVGGPPNLSSRVGPLLYSVPQRQPRSQIHGFGRPLLLWHAEG